MIVVVGFFTKNIIKNNNNNIIIESLTKVIECQKVKVKVIVKSFTLMQINRRLRARSIKIRCGNALKRA